MLILSVNSYVMENSPKITNFPYSPFSSFSSFLFLWGGDPHPRSGNIPVDHWESYVPQSEDTDGSTSRTRWVCSGEPWWRLTTKLFITLLHTIYRVSIPPLREQNTLLTTTNKKQISCCCRRPISAKPQPQDTLAQNTHNFTLLAWKKNLGQLYVCSFNGNQGQTG